MVITSSNYCRRCQIHTGPLIWQLLYLSLLFFSETDMRKEGVCSQCAFEAVAVRCNFFFHKPRCVLNSKIGSLKLETSWLENFAKKLVIILEFNFFICTNTYLINSLTLVKKMKTIYFLFLWLTKWTFDFWNSYGDAKIISICTNFNINVS